jgi:hypothetical protein
MIHGLEVIENRLAGRIEAISLTGFEAFRGASCGRIGNGRRRQLLYVALPNRYGSWWLELSVLSSSLRLAPFSTDFPCESRLPLSGPPAVSSR